MQDNTGSPVVARLAADAATTNTTPTDVAGLSFPVGANEIWTFDFLLKIGSSSAAGTKYAMTFPTGGTLFGFAFGTTGTALAYTQELMTASGTLTTTVWNSAGLTTAAVGAFMRITGTFVNGATPGVVQLQQAKITSGTATVYAGSSMTANRVA